MEALLEIAQLNFYTPRRNSNEILTHPDVTAYPVAETLCFPFDLILKINVLRLLLPCKNILWNLEQLTILQC